MSLNWTSFLIKLSENNMNCCLVKTIQDVLVAEILIFYYWYFAKMSRYASVRFVEVIGGWCLCGVFYFILFIIWWTHMLVHAHGYAFYLLLPHCGNVAVTVCGKYCVFWDIWGWIYKRGYGCSPLQSVSCWHRNIKCGVFLPVSIVTG